MAELREKELKSLVLTLTRLLWDMTTLVHDLSPWPDHQRSCSSWSSSPDGDFCDCGYRAAMADFKKRMC